jgi:opacity protein-like surface antigen
MLSQRLLASALLLSSCTITYHAHAEERKQITPYLGASLGLITFKERETGYSPYETEHALFTFRGGLKFNQYVSAEMRFGKGSEENNSYLGAQTSLEIESYTGLYIRGHIPVNERISFYGIAGKTKGRFNLKVYNPFGQPYEDSDSESDTSFGLGAEVFSSHTDKQNFGLGIEYMEYIDKDAVTVSGITLSAIIQL